MQLGREMIFFKKDGCRLRKMRRRGKDKGTENSGRARVQTVLVAFHIKGTQSSAILIYAE
jgi:hypothetical protein